MLPPVRARVHVAGPSEVDTALQRFVRFLRAAGVRVSTVELLDAAEALRTVAMRDRATVKAALATALLKDRRDRHAFETIFDRFFHLLAVEPGDDHGHGHAHDDLSRGDPVDQATLSEQPADTPEQGHSHGAPSDLREYFDPEDLAEQYNLHQEANKIDLAALTDEIVLAADQEATSALRDHVEVSVEHLRNPTLPSTLADSGGRTLDAELTIAEQHALLAWLSDELDGDDEPVVDLPAAGSSAFVDQLPEMLRRYLQKLLEQQDRVVDDHVEASKAPISPIDEAERHRIEDELRRLGRALDGGITHRRRPGRRGRIDVGRTMRRNMRHDGVPFRPVTVAREDDKPHLVLLVDVSLSVRSAARFTLEVAHQLQSLFTRVRTFAFVADLVEVTELFADHHHDEALEILMGGEVLDLEAESDYGRALITFEEEHGTALTRRTTLLVLGDGRTNGKPPEIERFGRLAERARHVHWWTPEPRRTWQLGACHLPEYAEHCDAVEVVRGTTGLERTTATLSAPDPRG